MVEQGPPGATVTTALPRMFGSYELIAELGRGGMGVVFQARQRSVNRIVAVKLPAAGEFASPEFLRRFQTEAEAAASLDHPNIVPIYEVGEWEGQPFFSMKLVEGGSLAERMAGGQFRPAVGEAVDLIGKLARAVHYAHERGVLHRDIKPGNVLLDAEGEPYLTDFGLARVMEKESQLTQTLAVLGTPNYMSPEQARGDGKQLTIGVDVYGLGAVFYELLARQPPFIGASALETAQLVLTTEPSRPSTLNREVDRDLETICLKCLEKDPARRYGSAGELAADLERWERDEPIRAIPQSTFYVLGKLARRHKGAAAALVTIISLLVAGVAVSTWQARLQRGLREQAAQEAEERRVQLVRMHVGAGAGMANGSDAFPALLQFAEALRLEGGDPAAEDVHRRRLASLLRTSPQLRALWTRPVNGLASARFSPDGARVVCADTEGSVRIFDGKTAVPLAGSLQSEPPLALAWFTGDGRYVVTADIHGGLRHWNPASGEPAGGTLPTRVQSTPGRDYRDCVDYSADGRWLVAILPDGVRAFSVPDGEPAGPLLALGNMVYSVQISPDGRVVALCGDDPALQIVELPSGRPLWTPAEAPKRMRFASFSPDGRWLVAVDLDEEELKIWDVEGRQLSAETVQGLPNAFDVQFSPDGGRLAVASGGYVTVFDTRTWRPVGERIRHRSYVVQFAFSGTGDCLATASYDGTARVWETETGRPLSPALHHSAEVFESWFSPDGAGLLTASADGATRQWALNRGAGERISIRHGMRDPSTVRISPDSNFLLVYDTSPQLQVRSVRSGVLASAHEEPGGVLAACFNSDGSRIALATGQGVVRLWDLKADAEVFSVPHSAPVYCLEFSPDGDHFLTGCDDGAVRLWKADDGALVTSGLGHDGPVRHAVFSPDGRHMVTGSQDRTVRVWDVQSGAQVGPALVLTSPAYSASVSADGRRILTVRSGDGLGGTPGAMQLWDAAKGDPVGPEHGLLIPARYPAPFSADGQRCIVSMNATSVAICDAATGDPAMPPLEHRFPPRSFAFSPDGRYAVTSANRDVHVWDAVTGEAVAQFLTGGAYIVRVDWTPDGREVFAQTNQGSVHFWDVSPANASVLELTRMAELMASHRLHPKSGAIALTRAELRERWEQTGSGGKVPVR